MDLQSLTMYSYDELPNDSIRLADLQPAKFEDPIVINLRTEHFDPESKSSNIPFYEALSYAWGSRENPSSIRIHGAEDGDLEITRDLEAALRHLRYPDRLLTLWVDAICINQANEIEKGAQVAMMGDLYRFAARVIVWLGPEANHSDRAMTSLAGIGHQVEINYSSAMMTPSASATDITLADFSAGVPLNPDDLVSVYYLLSRSWFDRLWVILSCTDCVSESISC
jgi:hypothetical protein